MLISRELQNRAVRILSLNKAHFILKSAKSDKPSSQQQNSQARDIAAA